MLSKGIIANLFLLLITGILSANSPEIFYGKSNFEEAKIRAHQEGKLLFIDFYANWCTPCKWMDETTYKDERVIKKLTEDYISIKVDIDEMEGFELKSRYDIMYLPTILIFNQEGKMIERIEETLSPTKMIDILNKKMLDNAPVSKLYPINTSPKEASKMGNDVMLSEAEYRQYFSEQYEAPTKTNYQMQMGVFANFDGAAKKSDELQKMFLEEITILEESKNDKVLYKVIMGNFATLPEAESFKKLLMQKFSLDSIIL